MLSPLSAGCRLDAEGPARCQANSLEFLLPRSSVATLASETSSPGTLGPSRLGRLPSALLANL